MSSVSLPVWIRERKLNLGALHEIRGVMSRGGLHTVCDEARCPNRSECFARGTATFLIMGDVCTRSCRYCSIAHGRPRPLDADEPAELARAVIAMGLKHVVVTSVDRDDLPDGGAAHFAAVIAELKKLDPRPTVEVLTPDFRADVAAVDAVLAAGSRRVQPQRRDGGAPVPRGAPPGALPVGARGDRARRRARRHDGHEVRPHGRSRGEPRGAGSGRCGT